MSALLVLGMLFHVSILLAEKKEEQFAFLVNGMKFEREKMITGIVRGKGERTLVREIDGRSVTDTGPVEYFLAFDFQEGSHRIDRYESNFREKGGYDRWLAQYIEKNDSIEYCSSLLDDRPLAVVFVARPKEGDYDFRNNRYCGPLDIRLVGMLRLGHFTYGGATPFDQRMENHRKRIPEVLVEEEKGIYRYEYHQRVEERGELRKSVLWIDARNGFTRRRSLSIWEFDSRKEEPWIVSDTRVSWKKMNGVWVPVDISFEKNLPIEENERLVMAFDWENINKPVDKDLFTYCDFETSEHTPILTVPLQGTQGKSNLLGDIINLCGTKEGRLLEKQRQKKEDSFRWRVRSLLMTVGAALIILGLYWKRAKEKGSSQVQN